MKFLDRLMGRKAASESDGLTDILRSIVGAGRRAKSGAIVSRENAMRVSVVLNCLRVLAEGVSQVPFKLLQEGGSSVSVYPEIKPATGHPLYDLLYRKPNGWMTSFEFRETLMIHAALGNAYVFKNVITIGGKPRIAELILLDPGRVKAVQHADWSITYQVRGAAGGIKEFPQEAIWHIRGPSWDGVLGLDVLNMARETIGLAISTEETHASLHEKGVQPSGLYSVDGSLNPEQYKSLKKWIEDEHAGADKKGSVMLLDRAAKFTSMAMTGVDSQHLETRRFQIEEICRLFRVLPLMAGYSDKTQTFASAEQMFLAHVVHTLMPWYERIQQSADVNLLTDAERAQGLYTKLVEHGLLRGAIKDTGEYLYRMTMGGIMARNEARAKLDLNPLDGLDEPLTPTNMTNDPTGAPAQSTTGA